MEAIRADEISKIIRQQIEGYSAGIEVAEVGTVIKAGDGIAEIYGLERVMAGELLDLPHEVAGIALNLEEDKVGAILFGDYEKIKEGDEVRRTGRIMSVPIGDELVGRVVDPLGRPLDGRGPIDTGKYNPLEKIAPGVMDRQPVRDSAWFCTDATAQCYEFNFGLPKGLEPGQHEMRIEVGRRAFPPVNIEVA